MGNSLQQNYKKISKIEKRKNKRTQHKIKKKRQRKHFFLCESQLRRSHSSEHKKQQICITFELTFTIVLTRVFKTD